MEYKGQKAIISLTSWKGRIDMASNTLYNLVTMCPGFHIVLVLSEEEFPNGLSDLPQTILQLENDYIEILWVKKNYKTLKKVIFTMKEYPDVPVISADDDHIYMFNYAEKLYETYQKTLAPIVTADVQDFRNGNYTAGWATLYSPHCFGVNEIDHIIQLANDPDNTCFFDDDDAFMEILRCIHRIVPVHIEQDQPTSIVIPTDNGQCNVYTDANKHGEIRMKQGIATGGLIFTYLGL